MISNSLDNFLINFSFVSILITTLFFWVQFSFGAQKEIQFWQRTVPNFLVSFCSILILLNFITRWISTNHFPLSNLYESLLFLTLALLLFLIYFQFTLKKNFVGVLILPIVLFINTFATFTLPVEMQQPTSLVPALQSNWLMMHVTIMMLSYAALIFGSLLAITFLIVRYILKDKITNRSQEIGSKFNLQSEGVEAAGGSTSNLKVPAGTFRVSEQLEVGFVPQNIYVTSSPLTSNVLGSEAATLLQGCQQSRPEGEAITENQYPTFKFLKNIDIIYDLDNLSYRVLTFGFPLLTIGILSGSVWANETWGSYWNWDPKETWALITWFVYAIYLHSRIIKGWRGTKPALIATFGFVTVWICYLGVNVFAKGLHSYGWFFTN